MASSSSGGEQPVLICGGGIIGCAVAYYLAKRGVKAIILEASAIAAGASGKVGGFLARDWGKKSPIKSELATKSFQIHMELASEFPECNYRRVDTWAVIAKQEHPTPGTPGSPATPGSDSSDENTFPMFRQRLVGKTTDRNSLEWESLFPAVENNIKEGYPLKPIGELSECIPWLVRGIERVTSMGTTENTAQVNPFKLTCTFFDKAREMVGTEMRKCRVVDLVKRDYRITGVKISTGEVIPATRVVLVLGPWSNLEAMQNLGLPKVKIHKAASIIMENVPTTPHSLFMTYSSNKLKEFHMEWHARNDGTLFVAGEESQHPLPELANEVEPSQAAIRRIKEAVEDMAPGCTSKTITEQACYLPKVEDDIPIIGKIRDVAGLYVATGHNVWGILNAPATGAALAELIVDNKCTLLHIENFDPFREMKKPVNETLHAFKDTSSGSPPKGTSST